jgi:hypothetical protein
VSARQPWYLAVGERLDEARCALLLDTFRPEIVRVGRALRAKVEAEHPGAAIFTTIVKPRNLVNRPGGYVRRPEWDAIGLGYLHAATESYGPGFAAWVQVEWETGRVSVYVMGERWRFDSEPEGEG